MSRPPVHGHAGTKPSGTYTSWASAKQRCLNERNPDYPRYGARGIRVCARWMDFANFLDDLGPRPEGLTLDRMDPEKHYSCGSCQECLANGWEANCRWETRLVQRANQRKRAVEVRTTEFCDHGHELVPENVYHRPDTGARNCRTCCAGHEQAKLERRRQSCVGCGRTKDAGAGRRLCDQCRSDIVDSVELGWPRADVAARFGVSKRWVAELIKEARLAA